MSGYALMNGRLTALIAGFEGKLSQSGGATLMGYKPPGANGIPTKVQTALDRIIKPRVDGDVVRKIVVIGSSTAAGYGAANNNGWAQQLATTMTARGWTVVNKAVGGDTTQQVLQRFHRDVLYEAPDICIIALVLGNEGLAAANTLNERVVVYDRFLANLRKMVCLCRQNNIVPVIADNLPNDAYDALDRVYLRNAHRWLDQQKVMSLGWLDMLESDAGDGHYRTVFQGDGVHTNPAGHAAMYYAVAPSMFDSLLNLNGVPEAPKRGAGWKTTVMGDRPLFANFDAPMRSFTVAFRCATRDTGKGLWGVNNAANADVTRISTGGTGGTYRVDVGGPLIETAVPVDGRERHHAVVYEHDEKRLSYYIDSVLQGSLEYQQTDTVKWMCFMDRGGTTNTSTLGTISEIMVYRTALNAASVRAIFDGDVQKAGLDLYCPLGDPDTAQYSHAANYAPTASRLYINVPGVVVDAIGANAKLQAMRWITEAAADPVLSDVPSKSFVVWKNTTSGALRVWVNDGGRLRSVAFSA
ncbi:SGNH/GDSL hydrolase family protein [Massilia timonae]|uniref:SGNH/GDSL hydrolase family protein n=1 Tax=Massilia timonae TaxID=47229 RepID=UPI0028D2E993|nr:GDSL-type esterase/lipase family protein [Massilia timonae]